MLHKELVLTSFHSAKIYKGQTDTAILPTGEAQGTFPTTMIWPPTSSKGF